MTLKAFPTLAVFGAYTGRLLVEGGFGDIQEVFDHLYPGIMTLGISAMAQRAKQHLGEVMPVLGELEEVHGDDWRSLAKAAVEMLGDTLSIDGPLENIDPLKTELDYLQKHRPDVPVTVVTPEREGAG